MKRLSLSAILLAGLLLFTACGGQQTSVESPSPSAESPEPIVLPFSLPYYKSASLHPITGKSQTNLTLSPLVYEGLFALNNEFQAEAVLADSWQTDDTGLVWTIRIKERTFSDGTPLSASHVASSLELARKSEVYAQRLRDIRKISGEGDSVTITLSRPHGTLPILLDIPIVLEQENGIPLGTGWYRFAPEGENLSLQATASCPEGLPDQLSLTPIQSADDLISAFDSKDVSLVVTDLSGTDTLGFSGGYEFWDHPSTTMLYLGLNTNSGICRDPILRRAISGSLDREQIVNVLYSLHARAAVLPVSPASSLYDQTLAETLPTGESEILHTLERTGYSQQDGVLYQGWRPVNLTLIISSDNAFRLAVADAIAEDLGKLGLNVTVKQLPWQEYVDHLTRGNFDLYLAETMLTADFQTEALIGSSGTLNYSRWKHPQADSLLEQFRSASESEKASASADLYRLLLEECPIAPICFKEQTVLTQWGQLAGLTPTRGNCFAGGNWKLNT